MHVMLQLVRQVGPNPDVVLSTGRRKLMQAVREATSLSTEPVIYRGCGVAILEEFVGLC
jgi:hypothetical protein